MNSFNPGAHMSAQLPSFAPYAVVSAVCGSIGILGLALIVGPATAFVALIGAFFALIIGRLLTNKNSPMTWCVTSVYFWCIMGVMISSYYRIHMNDLFQNESDPLGFFLRTEDAGQALILGEWVENQYEMRSATLFWIITNKVCGILGISYTPEVGASVNCLFAAASAGIGGRIVEIWTRGRGLFDSVAAQYRMIVWFCLSGLMLSVTTILLRDIFGCFYFSLTVWACSAWNLKAPGSSSRIMSACFALLVVAFCATAFALLRPEMGILTVLYFLITWASRRSVIGVIFMISVALVSAVLFARLYIGAGLLEVISSRSEDYKGLASDISSGFSTYIFGSPFYVKAVVGPWYLSMYPVPFFVGFMASDSYGLFKMLNVFWSVLAVPILIGCAIRLFNPGSNRFFNVVNRGASGDLWSGGLFNIRGGVMFISLLFLLVGMTSIESRHLVPILVLWCAVLATCDWRNDSLMKNLIYIWVAMAFSVNVAWLFLKM